MALTCVRVFGVAALLSLLIYGVMSDGICGDTKTRNRPEIVPDTDDCASFFICHNGQQFHFSCASKVGPTKVFDPKSLTCVQAGSKYDHSACNSPWKPYHMCVPGMYTSFPDDDSCAKYYQCMGTYKPIQEECPYPRLYNVKSHTCELYLSVKCGARKEPKDPCEYDSNQCEDIGCVPCRQRYGTCIGYSDGPNQWEDKPWTPYFVICKDQRVILHGDCRKSGQINIFNPVTRTCMPMSSLMKIAASAKLFV